MRIRLFIVALVSISCGVQAAFVTNWDTWSGVDTINDAASDTANSWQDITTVRHYYDADYHYFRMDLESGTQAFTATDYMINIDSGAGGQSAATSGYLIFSLSGINQIVDTHLSAFDSFSLATSGHNHISDDAEIPYKFTTTFLSTLDTDFQGGESYFEWKINKSILPTESFTIYGSSLSVGLPAATAYDVTSGVEVIPEPATFALMGLAAFVCGGLRRHMKRR